jgi:Glycosyltransferase family 9 (heptosyltransferase)
VVYDHVKTIDPDTAEADWNLALIHLLRGDFAAGLRGREARWKMPSLPGTAGYPKFPQPMWLGEENIEGKTILICADEGLGDTIQFVRYAPMLTALGARVILLPQEPLYPLLSGLPGVSQCLPNLDGGLPAFDVHCPIMSLPLAFRTTLETIPAPTSYLPTPAEDRRQVWQDRLGRHDRLRVGLVWSGNPKHKNDHNRSIPLRTFSSILDADATFVSLQKDSRSVDKAILLERTDIVDLTAHLTDFMETAALISCLDLVITVDTSVAHLAGALGCPTWILLPYTPDWRWLLDRDHSPWYPTVRLFRQTETRDYASVLDRVRTELLMLVTAK